MKKIRFWLVVLATSLLFCNPVYARRVDVDVTGYQTTSAWVEVEQGVNVRIAPREGNNILTVIGYGEQVEYLGSSCANGWGLINYEGKMRYIIQDYISFTPIENAAGPALSDLIPDQQTIQEPEPIQEAPAPAFYATCYITHYCACPICCGIYSSGYTANGSLATSEYTVAAGQDLPFGTRLLINGQVYQVQDRGVGNSCIDIFCDSHEQALARGAYYTDVYIVN